MKLWLKILVGVCGVIVLIFIGVPAYLGYSMTRAERVPVETTPAQHGLKYENITFTSTEDHLRLSGWLLPAENSQKIIIMVHGEDNHRADPEIRLMEIAAALVDHGYNVLTFDLRGHGESEGSRITGGYLEKRDLLGAVEYVKEARFQQIGVIGFSLGAVTAILAAAENTDIQAVIADSSFADLNDIIEPEFRKRTRAPIIFLKPILFMIKVMYGVDFSAIKPVEAVPFIPPRPMFFIHGELDEQIPAAHARRLYEAGSESSQLWIAPGAGHCTAYKDYPQEYLDRVTGFLAEALK